MDLTDAEKAMCKLLNINNLGNEHENPNIKYAGFGMYLENGVIMEKDGDVFRASTDPIDVAAARYLAKR